MKKWIPVGLLALCMAMLVLPVRAAAEPYGVYDLQVQNSPAYTLTPLDAWGNGVTDSRTETVEGAERQVFSGVEGFRLTFPGTPGSQYMVFLLQGASSVPGADNVRYTAQQSGGSTTVFEIWPEKLTEGEYHVYLSGTDLSYRQVAGFRVVFFDVPGDVNGDRAVTAADAHLALQQVVKETTLSGKPLSGAEMDGRAGITAMDAALILEKAGAASALYPETVTAAPSGALTVTAGQGTDRQALIPGDQVTVSLVLEEIPLSWCALQGELRYDQGAFALAEVCWPGAEAWFGEENIRVNTKNPGKLLFAACGFASADDVGQAEAVTVLQAVFTVKSGAPAGPAAFSLAAGGGEETEVCYEIGFAPAGGSAVFTPSCDNLRETVTLKQTGITSITAPEGASFAVPKAVLENGTVTAGERTVLYRASVIGTDGREDPGGVSWSLSPAGAGVTVDESGRVRITGSAVPQTYTLTATPAAAGVSGAETRFTVTKEPAEVTFVLLDKSRLLVDSFTGGTVGASAFDQYGGAIPVTWHLSRQQGLTVGADGAITVAAGAPAGEVTVTGTDRGGKMARGVFTIEAIAPSAEQVAVNWEEVVPESPALLTYGASASSAFSNLPASGTAVVEAISGRQTLAGTYALQNSGTLSVGGHTLTVVFTVTQPGDYQGMRFTKTYSVTVRAAQASGAVTIRGEVFAVGTPLTAVVQGMVDSVHWVWYHGDDLGTPIGWGESYTPREADAGKTLVAAAVCSGNYVGRLTSRPVEIPRAELPPEEEPLPEDPPKEEPQPEKPPVEEPRPEKPPVEEPPVEEPPIEEPPVEEPLPAVGEVIPAGEDRFLVRGDEIGRPVKAEIPALLPGLGTVVVAMYSDGTEEILMDSLPTEDGVMVTVPVGTYVRLWDNGKTFHDVAPGDWYAGALTFTSARGILNGREDGSFAPMDTLNRAMAAQILYNLAGRPGTDAGDVFLDVAGQDWFAQAVSWGATIGVLTGHEDGTYRPGDPVTREQMVTMLYRCSRYLEGAAPDSGGITQPFGDVGQVSDYALRAMAWAVETGIISGIPQGDGTLLLSPQGTALRGQAAQIMMNYCMNLWAQ